MREDIKKLKDHFETKEGDKALFGNPVFLKDFENLESKYEEGSQKLLVNEILDTYIVILSTLRNQTKDKDVQLSIAAVTGRIENLKSHFLKNNDLKKKLQNLWAIKTGDAIVQRKALLELMAVFQKASKLNSRIQERKQNRRKRRQVRRTRIHSV
ncbi:interferon gamma 1-like [Scleropages formosus]|uniref:interferon gamma 1-like n=1 Tax=Scleropages formosus TaxID=113540 RepID=UPI0006340EA6|nr:interferon gamma 1-like [Scleropages formosus]